jgi:hypothetical protein
MNARNAMAQISPKLHPRFSPNLFKWLRKNKNIADRIQVFISSIDATLWIGFQDELGGHICFHGNRLMGVLTGVDKYTYAHSATQFNESLTVIPDFWDRYVTDGRCAIDQAHAHGFVGDETRWHNTSDTARACLWCGKVTQQLETRLVTTEIKEWRNDGCTAPATEQP